MLLHRRALLLAGAAATVSVASRGVLAQGTKTIKLGHIVDSSGVLKSVAEPSVVAADMAIDAINAKGGVAGRKLELIRYDTGSDPRQAAVAARKLIEDDQVYAIIGPFSSGETLVAMNDAERAQIVMFPVAASKPGLLEGKSFLWRLVADERTQFRHVLATMKRKNIKAATAEIIYISDETISNDAGTKTFPALLQEAGIKFGTPIAFQYKSFDVASQVAKAMESKPDVIALAGLPEAAAKVVHELRRQSFSGRIIGSQLWADPNIRELFGADGDGSLFAADYWKGSSPEATAFDKKFVELNAARGIKKLGAFHTDAITYDIVFLMAQCLGKIGIGHDDSDLAKKRIAIRDTLKTIAFTGILGKNICFKAQEGQGPGYVIELRNSDWTLFDEWPALSCT